MGTLISFFTNAPKERKPLLSSEIAEQAIKNSKEDQGPLLRVAKSLLPVEDGFAEQRPQTAVRLGKAVLKRCGAEAFEQLSNLGKCVALACARGITPKQNLRIIGSDGSRVDIDKRLFLISSPYARALVRHANECCLEEPVKEKGKQRASEEVGKDVSEGSEKKPILNITMNTFDEGGLGAIKNWIEKRRIDPENSALAVHQLIVWGNMSGDQELVDQAFDLLAEKVSGGIITEDELRLLFILIILKYGWSGMGIEKERVQEECPRLFEGDTASFDKLMSWACLTEKQKDVLEVQKTMDNFKKEVVKEVVCLLAEEFLSRLQEKNFLALILRVMAPEIACCCIFNPKDIEQLRFYLSGEDSLPIKVSYLHDVIITEEMHKLEKEFPNKLIEARPVISQE